MGMGKDERAEARRICEAATPGPWTTDENSWGPWDDDSDCPAAWMVPEALTVEGCEGDYLGRADAEFIAHARTGYPAALDELDRLESEVAALRLLLSEGADELELWSERDGQGPPCGICQYEGTSGRRHDAKCLVVRMRVAAGVDDEEAAL